MKPHLILDFETMGQNVNSCVVLDCSWIIFDWNRFLNEPYSFEELIYYSRKQKFDVKSQVDFGYKVEKSALEFWQEQDREVKKKIKPSEDDISIEYFLELFTDSIQCDIKYWWSRSNTFDPIILWRLAKDFGYEKQISDKLPYWLIRDTRTFIDSKTNFDRKLNSFVPIKDEKHWDNVFKKHDSQCDVAADVMRLQTLVRLENGQDATDR